MKDKKKLLIILLIFVGFVLTGIGGYLIYNNTVDNNESNNTENSNVDNDNEDNDDNSVEDDNKDEISETVKFLYEVVIGKKMNEINSIYSGDGFSFNILRGLYTKDEHILFSYGETHEMALNVAGRLGKIETEKVNQGDVISISTVKVSDVKDAYHLVYGNDKEFLEKPFHSAQYDACEIVEDNYVCKRYIGGGIVSPYALYTMYRDYEIDDSNLYIYEKAIFGFDDFEKAYYSDFEYLNKIAELTDKDVETVFKTENDNYTLVYKHTFKKNSDGTYYWYSTAPVDTNNN